MTMTIVPWKISSFNGAGIEQPGMDHIGFRVSDIKAFTANVDKVAKTNIHFAPRRSKKGFRAREGYPRGAKLATQTTWISLIDPTIAR